MADNDVINGGGGADIITGGLGLILTGGAGPDVFKYVHLLRPLCLRWTEKNYNDFDYTQDALSFSLVNGVLL